MNSIAGPGIAFAVIIAVINLTFVAMWLRYFRQTREYARLGFLFAGIALAFEILVLSTLDLEVIELSISTIVWMDAALVLRLFAVTVVGMLIASKLDTLAANGALQSSWPGTVTRYSARVPGRTGQISALILIAGMLVYTLVLFKLADAKPGTAWANLDEQPQHASWLILAPVVAIAFSEEILFRLGLQNGLTYLFRNYRCGHWAAVVIVAAIWSLGHVGMVDPEWAKFAQMFVFGLVLGELNRRHGIAACMLAHCGFNLATALLTPFAFGESWNLS